MNAMELFKYEDREVRVVQVEDGEPRFVAADVCAVLELGNVTEALRGLDEDEKMTLSNPESHSGGRGGAQFLSVITEAGLYSLVLRSRKPQAKRFKRWVTHEVLPSIRKHGAYLTPEKIEEALLDPDVLIRLATDLKTERLNRLHAEQQRDEAIRTKALIGSHREATAMATASAAIRRAEALAEQVGDSKNWKQVKAIPWIGEFFVISKGMWSVVGKTLKNISAEFGLEVRKVPDSAYGEVCAFHVQTIHVLRCRLLADSALLAKYRLSH